MQIPSPRPCPGDGTGIRTGLRNQVLGVRISPGAPTLNVRSVYDVVLKYRISVIDDFRDTFSFIDAKLYGENYFFGAGKFGGNHRGYQKSDDAIWVFVNYVKVGVFKNRQEARAFIQKLIDDCPKRFNKDFEEHKGYLID